MSFAWPHLLWLLAAPTALLAWEYTHRRRSAVASGRPKILRAEAGPRALELLPRADDASATALRPRRWFALGLALSVVALARPQWGRVDEPVFDQSREILLAVDLSRSMLADDVRPSRLARAKLLIQALLEKLAGERVGLIVYSGTAFLQSPLSADYEILREFLPALDPGFLPVGGTSYRAMLDAALGAFAEWATADRFLIVLSDGEATENEWRSRVAELKRGNIRVLGLGVGTAAGAMIPDESGGFVKDERGAVVLSKLESGTLRELADETDGAYRDASAWVDLAALLKETVEAGRKGSFVEKKSIRRVERFQWPLALGLWCLLMSLCYEYPIRPRPRPIALGGRLSLHVPSPPGEKMPASPVGGAVSRMAGLLIVVLLLGTTDVPAAAPADHPAVPADPGSLVKIVGRLSAAEALSGRDFAELARETITWGSRLRSGQESVPSGPIRDGLEAVGIGSRLDPKTADWPGLRRELEALLQPPEEEDDEEEKPPPDQSQQDQDQQNQEQQSSPNQQSGQKEEQPPEPSDNRAQEQPPGESAFGDMQQKDEPPPPPPGDTQLVGGAPERKDESPEPLDPALALPLQKLDQLREQDSPAELFQLMEGDRRPQKAPGKNW